MRSMPANLYREWALSSTTHMIKLPRRKFLYLAAGAAALSPMSCIAGAQAYPSRPVRIVVGFAAGGTQDIVARLIGQWLADRLGQPFIIENRPGAASNIAAEVVVRAPADGQTLILVGVANAINATLYEKLNFDFVRDIAPVAGIARMSNVLLVHPSFPAKTVAEFITYTKANPGKISMASAGIGSPSHMAGNLFEMMTGINMIHIPYRGGAPALTDLIGGQVQTHFGVTASSVEYIRTGKLRALAVTTVSRLEALPDTPTVAEFVPGYEASTFYGVGAPKGTPTGVVDTLNKEINTALNDPKIKARLADLGGTTLLGPAVDFGKLIADETEKWGKVIRAANIKAE